jgi:hypothetical protein
MPRLMARLRSLVPALLLAAFAFRCGTFQGAAAWPWGPLGQVALLGVAGYGLAESFDPLRLGSAGRWLLAALLVSATGSLLASPVPRAGSTALPLAVAVLLIPAAVARLLGGDPAGRRRGLIAWSLVVAGVATLGLLDAWAGPEGRAALPLGHHNLLGAFLVVTLPVTLVPLRMPGPGRVAAAVAGALGVGALVATRSLSAGLAAVVVTLAAAPRWGRGRHLAAGLALIGLGLVVPRIEAVLGGRDESAAAREVYAAAALDGWAARPALGWGPGATPWRLAAFAHPRPGINPPGELVGETHSLPLQLGFELGASGLFWLLAVGALFGWRRWRERLEARDPVLLEAGLLGLLAGAVASLGDAWLQVPALPVALAASAGAALAGGAGAPESRPTGLRRWAAVAALLLLAATLVRPALALREWSRAAAAADRDAAASALAQAALLDPAFPLYRARWAWSSRSPPPHRARLAAGAAAAAGGVGPLWMRAGALLFESGDAAGARRAFARTMALDPLSGEAPFLLFVASRGSAVDCAARALLAEPRLAAATVWRRYPQEYQRAAATIESWPGIDAGWRLEMKRQMTADPPQGWTGSEEVDLAVEMDETPALAGSLHLFRREPIPVDLVRIRLDRGAVRRLHIVPASELATSAAAAFPADRCAPGDPEAPGEPISRDGFESGDATGWDRSGNS